MTALPMNELQKRLDRAHSLHPESHTLGDFRAEGTILEAETDALRHARKIITPHSDIAALFGSRSELLSWKLPSAMVRDKARNSRPRIVFPASTVGRKGCYELREAIRGLDVTLVLLGAEIEGPDFWKGFDTEKGGNWLSAADLVVLPAHVEHKPRRLLQAAACGIPVIASRACGLENVEGINSIDAGDAVVLRESILALLETSRVSVR
jgi:glycosyltransferase involved in cell wall biosynthesis